MCDNRVSYYIPRGYDYREFFVKCGNTDPHGGRAVCDDCEAKYGDEIFAEEKAVAADNWASRSAGWGDW
jgi:hypothetical protein